MEEPGGADKERKGAEEKRTPPPPWLRRFLV